jgi:hypothetical protein
LRFSTSELLRGVCAIEKQVDDVGRRLLGACQAWSKGPVRASLWRSSAALTATVLVAVVLGFGAGWLYRGPAQIVAGITGGTPKCDDQPDGGRLCWIPVYERPPPTEPEVATNARPSQTKPADRK